MSPRRSTTENGTHYGRHQGNTTTFILITLSCKVTAIVSVGGLYAKTTISDTCDIEYPRWYNDYGEQVTGNGSEYLVGCRDSEFDQYGDIAAFDIYPEWQRQISKFASVQDRLREWKPSVLSKIEHLSCLQIASRFLKWHCANHR